MHLLLCQKLDFYDKWHQHKHHGKVHWTIAGAHATALIVSLIIFVITLLGQHSFAASKQYSVTGQTDWESGTLANLDTDSTWGDIKVDSDGTWGARTWKTPPDSLTMGFAPVSVDGNIYVLRGSGDKAFWKYSTTENKWTALKDVPGGVYDGSDLKAGGSDTLYAILGNYTKRFYKYTISTNTWTELAETPDTTGPGSTLGYDGTNIFLLRGIATQDFWIYDTAANSWDTLAGPPATVSTAADLVYDSGYFYTLRGQGTTTFYRYDVTGNSWTTMSSNYPTAINEATNAAIYNGVMYIQHGVNTTSFYKCTISGTSCSGGWTSLADLPDNSRYAGIVYNSSNGYIYSFRGNGTFDLWKYDIASNKFVGTAAFPLSISNGSDMIWDGANHVYGFRGANTNSFYYYDITTNAWASRNSTGLPNLNYDTKAVKAGNYIYAFSGNSTGFYRYDTTNDGAGWTAMTGTPATLNYGASLAYTGSGDYIYATRGTNTGTFWAYSISNNNWTTLDPTDLPAGRNVYMGGRLISDGTNIYAIIGNGDTNFLRYNVGSNDWTNIGRVPFAPSYGTDITYNNGYFYATSGTYSDKMYEYDISGGTWRKLPNIQTQYEYDIGPYYGASIEYFGSGNVMVTRGNSYTDVLNYSVSSSKYLSSASYEGSAIDLTYVSSWVSLSVDKDTPGDSSVTTETRTSDDGSSWTSWQALSGTSIQSPAKRYIQVKMTLSSSTDLSQTPTVHSYDIVYNPDENEPNNPSSFSGSSQEVGGTPINSGETHNYSHPYFSWSGASDGESGLAGYYVYFGTNASADPVTDGTYQTATDYTVNRSMQSGNNYLLIKTKDIEGNISSTSANGFIYVYNGVSPVQEKELTTSADFDNGTLSNISSANDQLKLSSKSGFWKEGRLAVTPGGIGYGGGVVYKSSVNKLYVARGNNTTDFWEYDIATDAWTTKSSTGLGAIYYGGGIVNGPGNYIYAMKGAGTNSFYRYDISNDAAGWSDGNAEDVPNAVSYGGSLVYDGSRYIYAFRGYDDVFYRFDPQTTADGQWSSRANVNFGYPDQTGNNNVYNGAALTYDGNDTIYAIQGNLYTGGFARYSISQNSWTPMSYLPMSPNAGSSLVWNSSQSALYYMPGNIMTNMFKYNPNTQEWTEVSSGPSTFYYGAAAACVSSDCYFLRGYNSTSFYKYNAQKDSWYTPAFNIFGPNWKGTSYFSEYYGASIVHGNGKNFYAIRGNGDNIFVQYNSETGVSTRLPNLPSGTYSGASMVYDSTQNVVYLVDGLDTSFWKYDISSSAWSEEASDPIPILTGYGSSMVYDGSRYIYFTRGANTASWYRYDTLASAGSRWSSALPATGLGGQGYGAQLLYKDGYLYTMRGQNVNPNPLYKFDLSQLPGGSWTSLSSMPSALYNDGFLVDGNNGYFYVARAQNTNEWWQYNVSTDTWSADANFPGQIYAGGSGKNNGSNKILVLPGSGSNTWSDGIYTYIAQSDNSSFEESGTYTSESFDLTSVYQWANLTANYTIPNNTSVLVETQSSADDQNWSSWSSVTQEKTNGTSHEFSINSPTARYLKVKITMTSGDGILSSTINDFKVNYYQDTTAPDNPTSLSTAKSKESGGVDITTDNWYNYTSPYFTLPDSGSAPGAVDNTGGSGVEGYYIYFGTDQNADPSTLGAYQTGTAYTGSVSQNNATYYLRIKTKDYAGNTQGVAWTAFTYKYDSAVPTNPSQMTANPLGYTSTDEYTFTISADASDAESGLQKYQYRTGGDPESTWYDFDPELSTSVTIPNVNHPQGKYRDGVNQFYLRTVDNAGNTATPMNTQYYFGAQAPSPPQNLQVTPSENTVNSFSFSWDAPATFVGDENKIKYYYSVNALPTQYNTNETSVKAVGPSAFATQKGTNTFYVVAKDEANNIDYEQYASVSFTANTSAPGAPTYVSASDISDKEAQQFRLVVSWIAPDIADPSNFGGYDIYESTEENGTYTKIANTTGTAYVHTNLTKDSRHYYYVVSTDKTGNESAESSKANALATGRYTRPPKVTKDPSASPKAKSAVINWVTEREANSSVEYGTTESMGQSAGNKSTQFETDHNVTLSGLEPGTTYYYKAVFIDPDGNIGETSVESFITSPAPIVQNLKIDNINTSSMTVSWDTNVPAHGNLFFGKTSSFGGSIKEDDFPIIKHSAKLSSLESDSEYHIQVRAEDEEGNVFTSDEYTARTLPMPQVSGVKVQPRTGVDTPTLDVEYSTNVDTTTIVRFGPEGGKIKEYVEMTYNKDHKLELPDLLPSKLYSLEITGMDKIGNTASPQSHQVTTLSDTMPPKVLKTSEKKRVIGEGSNAEAQLTVKITTNEPSTMIVEASKGIGGKDFNIMSSEDSLNTDHTVILKLGDPGMPYSYRVRLRDASGNEKITDVKTIVVSRANKSAFDYIISVFSRSFSWIGQFIK